MAIEKYLMINEITNVVDNIVLWDGNPNTWQPPENYLMLVQSTTPAMIWIYSDEEKKWQLTEVMGAGDLNFDWDVQNSILITDQPDPNLIEESNAVNTNTENA